MADGARHVVTEPAVAGSSAYGSTRDRVETYFDKTATRTWERLTSDAPVSRIRQTVREGRDKMRALILSRLPADLTGHRVLDAGCGAGQMTEELARRGAQVVGIDISPSLIDVAAERLPPEFRDRVTFRSGDMLDPDLGEFDHMVAMDSLIYYNAADIAIALRGLEARVSDNIVFTVAPRTKLLMGMWYAGKLFPRGDRSPTMIPHGIEPMRRAFRDEGVARHLHQVGRVTTGFYISAAMELAE